MKKILYILLLFSSGIAAQNKVTILGSTGSTGGTADGNNYPTGLSAPSGVLTLQRNGLGNLTQDLNGRWLLISDSTVGYTSVYQNSLNNLQKVTDRDSLTTHDLFVNGLRIGRGKTNDTANVVFGRNAGLNMTDTAELNVFIGTEAGMQNMGGRESVGIGFQALRNYTTTGDLVQNGLNTAVGSYALKNLLGGAMNVANTVFGQKAGIQLLNGNHNEFMGAHAGGSIGYGYNNVIIGSFSFENPAYFNDSAFGNVSIGYGIGTNRGYKENNTIVGSLAGRSMGRSSENSLFGRSAGYSLTTGSENTFVGLEAGYSDTSASYNTYIGFKSGNLAIDQGGNTGVGNHSLYNNRGSSNTAIGTAAMLPYNISNASNYDNTIYIKNKNGHDSVVSTTSFVGVNTANPDRTFDVNGKGIFRDTLTASVISFGTGATKVQGYGTLGVYTPGVFAAQNGFTVPDTTQMSFFGNVNTRNLQVNPAKNSISAFLVSGTVDNYLLRTDPSTNSVGIGIASAEASAKFQIESTTRGAISFPRMTTAQMNAISSPVSGIHAYDNVSNRPKWYNGTSWRTFADSATVRDSINALRASIGSGGGGGTWGSITGTLSSQSDLNTALGLKSPLASPTFTGTPAAPTASVGTNTTQLASTAFVQAAINAIPNSKINYNADYDSLASLSTALDSFKIKSLRIKINGVTQATATGTDANHLVYNITDPTFNSLNIGGVTVGVQDIIATYSVADNISVVVVTANTITVNLPDASSRTGRMITIKNIVSGNTVTIDGNGSQTIDGSTTYSLASQYKYVTLTAYGGNWVITANN